MICLLNCMNEFDDLKYECMKKPVLARVLFFHID